VESDDSIWGRKKAIADEGRQRASKSECRTTFFCTREPFSKQTLGTPSRTKNLSFPTGREKALLTAAKKKQIGGRKRSGKGPQLAVDPPGRSITINDLIRPHSRIPESSRNAAKTAASLAVEPAGQRLSSSPSAVAKVRRHTPPKHLSGSCRLPSTPFSASPFVSPPLSLLTPHHRHTPAAGCGIRSYLLLAVSFCIISDPTVACLIDLPLRRSFSISRSSQIRPVHLMLYSYFVLTYF
jgi:hypothetical protein